MTDIFSDRQQNVNEDGYIVYRWNGDDTENRSIRAQTYPGAMNFTKTARNRTGASAVRLTRTVFKDPVRTAQ